jgi:hypothetical protein
LVSIVVDDPSEAWIAKLFARPGLNHALIGGQAVNSWIAPRETDDFDFVVSGSREVLEALESDLIGLALGVDRRQDPGTPSGPDFVRLVNATRTLAVDLQVAKTDYQWLVIERAHTAGELGLDVATPEDLIILKLLAMRGQDQRDIALLIDALADRLDWAYIEAWAETWVVSDRLELFRAAPR